MALVLGLALALSATDPAKLAERDPVGWLLTVAVLVGAIWAAPVVSQRPAITAVHWTRQLARHRNTVFAVGCVIIAGFGNPPVWQMVVDAALLLAYLLTVDALAAGPIGIRQLRRGVAPAAAAAASAVALLAAHAPVDPGAVWGRAVAAVAVAAAALAAGSALWSRQHEARQGEVRQGEVRNSGIGQPGIGQPGVGQRESELREVKQNEVKQGEARRQGAASQDSRPAPAGAEFRSAQQRRH